MDFFGKYNSFLYINLGNMSIWEPPFYQKYNVEKYEMKHINTSVNVLLSLYETWGISLWIQHIWVFQNLYDNRKLENELFNWNDNNTNSFCKSFNGSSFYEMSPKISNKTFFKCKNVRVCAPAHRYTHTSCKEYWAHEWCKHLIQFTLFIYTHSTSRKKDQIQKKMVNAQTHSSLLWAMLVCIFGITFCNDMVL